MFPFRDDLGSFLFFSLQDSSGRLALQNILPVSSLLSSFFLLSVHKRLFSRPPPVSGPPHRSSLIVRPPESYQPYGSGRPMSSPSFPTQRPICRLAPPPPPDLYGWWYLAWVWVCVEGRKRRRPPAVVVSPSSRRKASPERWPKCMPPPNSRLPSRCWRSAIDMSPRLVR